MFAPQDFRAKLRQQPFQPFRVVTSSGETYEVHRPDLMLVGALEVVVGRPGKDPEFFEGMNRVAIVHVTAMEGIPK